MSAILGAALCLVGGATAAVPAGAAPPAGSGAVSAAEGTIVPDPSWTCGSAQGIVPPTAGELVLRATLRVGPVNDIGATQYGNRRVHDVTGGTFTGDRIQGSVLTGGLDFELTLATGSIELEQVGMLRASDGTLIYLRTCGVAPADESVVRIVPDFEAPNASPHAWLNTGSFVGTRVVDAAAGTLELAIYDVSGVTSTEPSVQLDDPAGVPDQTWDCLAATGTRGATVFTETVTLGSSQSVGASKRGTRNVIPITGGRMSGRVAGTVRPGGADYQLIGGTSTLDARYTLATNDGEFIIVRNCGPFGRLVPVFETRAAGPYAFLNTGAWLSSDPGMAGGGVTLTFYERR
jgi:hypothetical protein